MKLLFTCLFLVLLSSSFGQNYDKTVAFPVEDIEATVICDSPKNGIVMAGYSADKALLYRIDSLGNILWKKKLDFNQTTYTNIDFFDLIATNDSNFVVIGNYSNDTSQLKEGVLLKFSPNGDIIWQQFLKEGPSIEFNSAAVAEMTDSSYLVAWGSSSSGDGISLGKFDQNGNPSWLKGFSFASQTKVTALEPFTDSTFLLAGDVYFGNGDNGLLAQISDTGGLIWTQSYANLKIEDVSVDSNQFFLAGYRSTDNKRFVASSSNSGVIQWIISTSTDSYDPFNAESKLVQLTDTALLALTPFASDASLAHIINKTGWVESSYELYFFMNAVMPYPNGGALFLGNGPTHGIKSLTTKHIGLIQRDASFTQDACFWSFATDSSTLLIPTADTLAPVLSNAPVLYQINITEGPVDLEFYEGCVYYIGGLDEQNKNNFVSVYPNISSGTFHFVSSINEGIHIQIFNALGQSIFTKKVDFNEAEIDLSQFDAGPYYYQVDSDGGMTDSGVLIIHQ